MSGAFWNPTAGSVGGCDGSVYARGANSIFFSGVTLPPKSPTKGPRIDAVRLSLGEVNHPPGVLMPVVILSQALFIAPNKSIILI